MKIILLKRHFYLCIVWGEKKVCHFFMTEQQNSAYTVCIFCVLYHIFLHTQLNINQAIYFPPRSGARGDLKK